MKLRLKIHPKRITRNIVFSVVFFALLKPDSLAYLGLGWLDTLLIVCDAFVLLYFAEELLVRRYRMSHITKCIIAIYLAMTLSTVLVSHDYFTLLKTAGPAIAMCMFTDHSMQRRPIEYLEASFNLLALLYTLNLITIILYYPNGMYQTDYVVGDTYLMGFDNGMIYNFLPLCCYAAIQSYIKDKRLFTRRTIFAFELMLISEIYVSSGSGIIQAVLLLLLMLAVDKNLMNHFIKPTIMFLVFYVGTFLITILRIQTYFADFIIGVLGKDLTMTGRTYLWDYAISSIKENPIIGIGATGRTVLGINDHYYPHPHCMLLDFLYKGGIIMFFFFVLLTILFIISYKKAESKTLGNIILITLFVFLVGEMVNSAQYKIFFWGIFVLIGYVNHLEAIRRAG